MAISPIVWRVGAFSQSGAILKKVEREFIRRAVEASDLAALRVAVYQACGDEELTTFGAVNQLDAVQKEKLKDYQQQRQNH